MHGIPGLSLTGLSYLGEMGRGSAWKGEVIPDRQTRDPQADPTVGCHALPLPPLRCAGRGPAHLLREDPPEQGWRGAKETASLPGEGRGWFPAELGVPRAVPATERGSMPLGEGDSPQTFPAPARGSQSQGPRGVFHYGRNI